MSRKQLRLEVDATLDLEDPRTQELLAQEFELFLTAQAARLSDPAIADRKVLSLDLALQILEKEASTPAEKAEIHWKALSYDGVAVHRLALELGLRQRTSA